MGELETGNYSAALSTFKKLIDIDGDLPALKKIQPAITQLISIVKSDDTFSVAATIPADEECDSCSKSWSYSPLRRRFTIADISGELDNLEVRCSRQRVVDKARPDITWEIPESWGSCSIMVLGAPGSSFRLLELPSA